ncbi:hypothetical protein GF373_08265 [bacterium]|nr:hypothetical protein [bacterium]
MKFSCIHVGNKSPDKPEGGPTSHRAAKSPQRGRSRIALGEAQGNNKLNNQKRCKRVVKLLAVLGSTVRGDANNNSDIGLLVEFNHPDCQCNVK